MVPADVLSGVSGVVGVQSVSGRIMSGVPVSGSVLVGSPECQDSAKY